ncbi:MAG TPA: hypothetical protein VE621_02760, partial [Bryobacteraceae bacterium]|nr:hypothetical protein [Bryobacteraceae bacterium]
MNTQVLRMCLSGIGLLAFALAEPARAQADMQAILERLEKLEKQNSELLAEIRALRAAVSRQEEKTITPDAVQEQLEVHERRLEEQAQTKVESGQKQSIRLTGMVLFNAFRNTSRYTGGLDNPTIASLDEGPRTGGGTVRQSIVGLEMHGGQFLGARLSGSLRADFFQGTASTLNQLFRMRTATMTLDWKNTSLMAGQEKPIFSPRDPTSLATVGVSPLTNAGNPWIWGPQIRLEQRFQLADETSFRAQVGVMQTSEGGATVPQAFAPTLERARPALQGRFELKHKRLEIAPGFHWSRTHVAGTSLPSVLGSVDWFYSPWSKLEFTGLLYTASNIANLGTLRQGFTIFGPGDAAAVRSRGGWAQLALLPTSRLSFHFFAGQQDDNNGDIQHRGFSRNLAYAGNVMYRVSTNFIVAFERGEVRTTYLPGGLRRNGRY